MPKVLLSQPPFEEREKMVPFVTRGHVPNLATITLGFVLVVLSRIPAGAEVIVLPHGEKTRWRYQEGNDAPGKEWKRSGFDDSAWKRGPAPLGYGEEGLRTEVSFGPDPQAKRITCYFRTSFAVEEDERKRIERLEFMLRRDDGAIVYLNGKEVVRSNMPDGPVDDGTLAAIAIGPPDERQPQRYWVSPSHLVERGENVLAVEVHQADPRSSDLCFDLEIKGYFAGEGPKQDHYREGMTAFALGDYERAAESLKQLEPDHPHYARTMALLAHQIYGQALNRPLEGLPYARDAYQRMPDDRDVVRAYIKSHVLSGVLFDDDDLARKRKTSVAPEHAFLVSRPKWNDRSRRIPRERLEKDLDYLEHVLVKCFAYLELRDIDYRGALDAIRLSLEDETPLHAFQLQVAKLITLFGDCHAGILASPTQYLPPGYAPYLAGSYRGRVYLFDPNASRFLDPDHPYVTAIDGESIDRWMEVAGYLVVQGSEQWRRRHALENLALVNYLRAELGLAADNEITLTMESEDGESRRQMQVPVRSRPAGRRERSRGESRRIGDDVGYLRIARMTDDPRFLAALEDWMDEFRDTKGLIIDVRGNSGGTKDVLFTLFPYFVKPDEPMRFVELSAYRKPMELPRPHPAGFMMSNMSAQPITSSRWTSDEQREQVRRFLDSFRPEWPLPAGKFSQWHVLALAADTNPNAYHYDKPLIVLQDAGTFSAGDIFLGALEDHPNTTLMGEPSGGGNGWMERYYLPNTRLGVVLCQSAKFRPNGKLYDGVGIEPDVALEAAPADVLGKSDSVLAAALRRLDAPAKRREDVSKPK